jgi:exosome complex component RRP45
LCIVAHEKVLKVRIDVHVLDDGGNVMDCATMATLFALKHFRRPATVANRRPLPLSIHHLPFSVTFALYTEPGSDDTTVLVDPSSCEERVAQGTLVLFVNKHRQLCAVQKAGLLPIAAELILHCAQIAQVKALEIDAMLQRFLELDPFTETAATSISTLTIPSDESDEIEHDANEKDVVTHDVEQVEKQKVSVTKTSAMVDDDDDQAQADLFVALKRKGKRRGKGKRRSKR